MKNTSRKIWSDRVRRWKAGGLTAKKFAERQGLSVERLYHWSSRLGREGRARGATFAPMIPPVVEIVGAAGVVGHGMQTISVGSGAEPFEVFLGERVCIRVPVHFDEVVLVRLVTALERC
jgi:hypothetical protein